MNDQEPISPGRPLFRYGNWEERFWGWIIDQIICIPLTILITGLTPILFIVILGFFPREMMGGPKYTWFLKDVANCWLWGGLLLIPWLYYALLESGSKQATFGKQLFKTKVVCLTGERVSFLRASVRYFSKYFSFIPLLLGYFAQPFTKKKQALHDLISGTLVIKEQS